MSSVTLTSCAERGALLLELPAPAPDVAAWPKLPVLSALAPVVAAWPTLLEMPAPAPDVAAWPLLPVLLFPDDIGRRDRYCHTCFGSYILASDTTYSIITTMLVLLEQKGPACINQPGHRPFSLANLHTRRELIASLD
jgi:hypothetical protein